MTTTTQCNGDSMFVLTRRSFSRLVTLVALSVGLANPCFSQETTVLRNVTVIDGTGKAAEQNQDVVIQGDRILSITPASSSLPEGVTAVDMLGKTIMPLIINTHGHLGILKGTTMSSANYTEENIRQHLLRYEAYGVGAVLSMGTDHEEIFALREASHHGALPGAAVYTAGIGFGVKDAVPPASFGMDRVFRPESPEEAGKEVRQLATHKPDVIKIWVDDFWGQYPKMKPEIYAAVIQEAHRHGLRVAAHLYHLEDARKLVTLGVDIIAHSVRDGEIDDALLAEMRKRQVVYIATLSLDEFAYVYGNAPDWLNDPFFQASLEPGVFQMITSPAYKEKVRTDPIAAQEVTALQMALKNLKKVYDAGILVALGTDSGAQPVRAQGFSEHMELELLVKAGLTPVQAITVATRNGAEVLRVGALYGTLEPGRKADFIVLDQDPSENIGNMRTIRAVWKNGQKVNDGPLSNAGGTGMGSEKIKGEMR
jgi:imidazolonepropionase-like amidohydrolase